MRIQKGLNWAVLTEFSHETGVYADLGCTHLKARLGWTPEVIQSHPVPVPDGLAVEASFLARCSDVPLQCGDVRVDGLITCR